MRMNRKVTHSIHKKELLLKYQEQKQRERQFQEDALKEANRLAKVLVDEFGIEKVYLVGPLTYGKFREGMELELALEGIPEGAYAKALGHMKQTTVFDVALLDLRQTDSWTTRSVKNNGKLLHRKANIKKI